MADDCQNQPNNQGASKFSEMEVSYHGYFHSCVCFLAFACFFFVANSVHSVTVSRLFGWVFWSDDGVWRQQCGWSSPIVVDSSCHSDDDACHPPNCLRSVRIHSLAASLKVNLASDFALVILLLQIPMESLLGRVDYSVRCICRALCQTLPPQWLFRQHTNYHCKPFLWLT